MDYRKYAPIFLRISLSVVFLWFGYMSIFHYESFLKYIPNLFYSVPISLREILFINGIFDLFFGAFLLVGFYTRISAFLLIIHLSTITYFLGYGDIAVRNIAIALATLSIVIYGDDELCIDRFLKKRKSVKAIMNNL